MVDKNPLPKILLSFAPASMAFFSIVSLERLISSPWFDDTYTVLRYPIYACLIGVSVLYIILTLTLLYQGYHSFKKIKLEKL